MSVSLLTGIDSPQFDVAASLIPGWNTLAAEVHNQSLTSSDIGFDFELAAEVIIDPLPSLNIARSPGAILLSWPANASYFNLYSATSLAVPITSTRITAAPILTNGVWSVSVNLITTENKFFRLAE